jgi:uncharacterized membrane protein
MQPSPASPHERDRGAVIPLVALALPVLILMTAFAVDLGRQRDSRRTMQARADVIALDMMRIVEGRTSEEVAADPATDDALRMSAQQNGLTVTAVTGGVATGPDDLRIEVVWGEWDEQIGFISHLNGAVYEAGLVADAVRVTASETTDYFFQPGSGGATRTAVATREPEVRLQLGSLVAGIHPQLPIPSSVGGQARLDATVRALNAQLSAQFRTGFAAPLPGAETGFDAVGYRGIAAADVELDRMATEAGFGSTDEMLDSYMTVEEFFDASIGALNSQAADGDPNAANAAAEMESFRTAMGVNNQAEMRLGDWIDASQGRGSAASSTVNAFDLLRGGAQVIDGANFISFGFTPDLPGAGGVFDASGTNVQMAMIEGPRMEWGVACLDPQSLDPEARERCAEASTAQVRFQVNLQLNSGTAFSNTPVYLPLVIEAGRADAYVPRLACSTPREDSIAEVAVDTGAVRVRVGTTTDLESETSTSVTAALLFSAGDLTLTERLLLALSSLFTGNVVGTSDTTLGGGSTDHVFFPLDDPNEWQRSMGGLSTSISNQFTTTFAADLEAAFTSSTLSLLGLGNLLVQLQPFFDELLDENVITPLLQAAGVSIGGADVLADEMTCGSPLLVREGERVSP